MSGQIFTHADLTADVERRCDVCIVGSGAGGAVLAAELASQGLDVVMLEEGSRVTRRDFTLQEGDAVPAMYQERGTRASADLAITVLQGRSVGGSTTINWTTCFRTPARILDHWRRAHGLEGLDEAELAPHFEAVEERLHIAPWPEELANGNNQVLLRGCRALGWDVAPLRRNVRGCANSGYCGLGCPVDGKQAMGITYVADAVAAGLTLYANVRAERLEIEGGRVVAVTGRVMSPLAGAPDGPRVRIVPRVAVSAGGALNGPALLLRSGLGGRVGRRTFLHPVVAVVGELPEPVHPYYGAPQSVGSHHHIDRGPERYGFFLEAAPLQPMLASVAFNRSGAALHDLMARLPHVTGLIALSVDGLLPGDEGGTVTLRPDGRMRLDYPISERLKESFRAATEALARVCLAGGAREVMSLHVDNVRLTTDADLPRLASAPYGAHEHAIFTAHQMGGCAMSARREDGVVDPTHRCWDVPNLFVVDGSVLPTALGVNPSETVYALARRAARFVGEAV
ncbi:MAG TPA: GMC family oxidoreductase [Myxococcota bacterium]|nr:GMC family oxidoreductase [Myxococcota bacterium]